MKLMSQNRKLEASTGNRDRSRSLGRDTFRTSCGRRLTEKGRGSLGTEKDSEVNVDIMTSGMKERAGI